MIYSMLIDPSKCIGCRACQVACKQWNQLPAEDTKFTGTYENPPMLSPITWTRIAFNEREADGGIKWNLTKLGCMHCTDAACMQSCPAGAIYHTDYGTVAIDTQKCIGCNYCAANCPFNAISFDRKTNVAKKCTFCVDRIANGLKPACANACPTGAITFGSRTDILSLAKERVAELKKQGKSNAYIYGLEEVSGTANVYVLTESPEYYGLPINPQVPLTARLWGIVYKPLRFVVVILAGFGLWANKTQSKDIQSRTDKKDKMLTNSQEVIEYQECTKNDDNNNV